MISRNHLLIAIFFLAAALFGGFLFVRSGRVEVVPPKDRLAPDLSFLNFAGEVVDLFDFRGKNLVVNAWASWCPFCRQELLDFASLQKEFGDKIVVLAVNRQEATEASQQYADKLGITRDLIFLLDSGDSLYQSIGGFSMPETIFIDQDGLIKYHKRGPMEREEMRRRVEDIFGL